MITYITTITLVRISVLLLVRRIFNIKPFRIMTTFVGILCFGWGIAIGFANVFQCTPISGAFNPAVIMSMSSHCINLQAIFYGVMSTGLFLDVLILALPIHQIWRLQLSNRRKYELTAILILGGMYDCKSRTRRPC